MGKLQPLIHALAYRAWGTVAKASIGLYYLAPREALQDEFFTLHRFAVKQAHTHRVRAETIVRNCDHGGAYQWQELEWCPKCGAVRPSEAADIPKDEWTAPNGP